MSLRTARAEAEHVVDQLGIEGPPVDLEAIAEHLGLRVTYQNLGSDVSGLLITSPSGCCIAVQEADHPNRKRFTIAHEIAHFHLGHQFDPGEHVHVDRGNYISQRGPRSSTGVDPKEIEANQFAASLLMPERMIRQQVARLRAKHLLDQHVTLLATTFQVSEQALTIRLTALGLL